jgi:hypothetical protein
METDSVQAVPAVERRRARRFRKPGLVWYQVLDGEATLETLTGVGVGFDISRLGLGITASRRLPENTRLLLCIRYQEFEVTTVAKVARVHPLPEQSYQVGLVLVAVPPSQRALVDMICS